MKNKPVNIFNSLVFLVLKLKFERKIKRSNGK